MSRSGMSRAWLLVALLRVALGAVFLYAGLLKASAPERFLEQIYAYEMTGLVLGRLVASILPAVEIGVGLMLIANVLSRPAACVIMGMCIMFVSAQIAALARGLTIECACFGESEGSTVGVVTLMRSGLLFGIAFFIYRVVAAPTAVVTAPASEAMPRSIQTQASSGFTLAELLVTLGVIGVLVGVLVPVTSSVRQSARAIECASNMRQVSAALIAYASANGGVFPPNSGQHQLFWYQTQHIAGFLSSEQALTDGTLARGAFLCPNDLDDSLRSFSMNLYASGSVSDSVAQKLQATPTKHGKLFRLGSKESARLMLLIESWSELPQPLGNPVGHASQAVIGLVGKPGQRFGGGTGIVWTDPPDATPGRFDTRASQITFNRHRRTGGQIEAPRGSANFAFLDGHVQLLRQDELVDNLTGVSRFNAMWSEIDRSVESAP